jgi:hypothetical protein
VFSFGYVTNIRCCIGVYLVLLQGRKISDDDRIVDFVFWFFDFDVFLRFLESKESDFCVYSIFFLMHLFMHVYFFCLWFFVNVVVSVRILILIVDTFHEVRSKREKRKEVSWLSYIDIDIDMRLDLSILCDVMMNNVYIYFEFRWRRLQIRGRGVIVWDGLGEAKLALAIMILVLCKVDFRMWLIRVPSLNVEHLIIYGIMTFVFNVALSYVVELV